MGKYGVKPVDKYPSPSPRYLEINSLRGLLLDRYIVFSSLEVKYSRHWNYLIVNQYILRISNKK
jgi:hypothetical protein